MRYLLCCLALLYVSATASAQEAPERTYATRGAPSDPKVDVRFNRYHDHAEMTKILGALQEAYPDRIQVDNLGDSYGERAMWLATVTLLPEERRSEVPAFWIDGGIHANELQGPEVVLYTAWYLCEAAETTEGIRDLLSRRVFYLLPQLSPDARDAHMYEPNTTHSPRTGLRPFDNDRDGRVDEDPADDLDGDGSIAMMRIRDPNGAYKEDPEHKGLMIRVKPDERGTHRLLGQEGIDNDGDGKTNEDGPGGYDPNRDWAWSWQPPYVQRGARGYPFSVEENRRVGDFVMGRPHIAGAQSYHNYGGMILRGPGVKAEAYDPADLKVYDVLGRKGERMLPGYRYLNVANDLYEVFGGEFDWFYNMLFTGFNYYRRSDTSRADEREFDERMLFGSGTIPWHEFDHPTYGKIEIGGRTKHWGRQPPSFLLEEECHRNMAFTLYHADQLPQLSVTLTVRPLGVGDLTEVTATLTNTRMTPTRLAVDRKRKISPPDRVTLSVQGGAKVLAGLTARNPDFRGAIEQKRRPGTLNVETVPGLSAVHLRWIVDGEGPFEVTVRSAKGGVVRATSEVR
ncbi:MAG: M14 family metallopeptidase [Planctomycetota bacterium]|jgi:hypothetical protein